MPMGPGKYDDLATYVREKAEADCVIVLVIGGNKGGGFAVQAVQGAIAPADIALLLRTMAEQVEQSARSS